MSGILLLIWSSILQAGYISFSGPLDVSGHTQQGQTGYTNFNANGPLEQSNVVQLYAEDLNKTLSGNLSVDALITGAITLTQGNTGTPGTIATGTVIDSWYFHMDPSVTQTVNNISITFDVPILGVIHSNARLDATDATLTTTTCNGSCTFVSNARGTMENIDSLTISADRLTLTIDALRVSNNNNFSDDFRIITEGSATVPVTLSYFKASSTDSGVLFNWSTTTEAGNLGFDLFAETQGQLELLNPEFIPSDVVDAVEPQHYSFESKTVGADVFWLADTDISGNQTIHGPFSLDKAFGRKAETKRIDWKGIRAEHHLKRESRSAVRTDGTLPGDIGSLLLVVTEAGLHRVTYEQLLAAGLDLEGARKNEIALLNRGQAIPVSVVIPGSNTFGNGAFVEFVAETTNSLYSKHNIYVLTVDQTLAKTGKTVKAKPKNGVAPVSHYLATRSVARQRQYSFASPNGDPWYDDRLLAINGPVRRDYDVVLDHYVETAAGSELKLMVWGVTNFPESPDHHLQVEFNGEVVADRYFDGLVDMPIDAELSEGLVREGSNTLTLHLPHDMGVQADLVNLEGYRVRYPRAFVAESDRLSFSAAGRVFEVTGFSSEQVEVYRQQRDGSLERLSEFEVHATEAGYSVRFAGTVHAANYHVVGESALLTPGLESPPSDFIEVTGARYHIISHADFIGADLDRLVAAREAEGYSVQVVDVETLYAAYSHHITDPLAIQAYLKDVYAEGADYVLLVGGDTYDYHDYLGQDAISFIPSLYAQTDALIRFSPVDALYTDIDGDLMPDMAIGRFPVRNSQDVATMVDQTLAYSNQVSTRTAVFAADAYDQVQGLDFMQDSENAVDRLPFDWQIELAYVDEQGVSGARNTLLDSINSGVALIAFFGHSGPTTWTFNGLLNTIDVANLENSGKPTVVTQFGCWNTYFVSPTADTLGHSFLLSGQRGAAAILGASTLTKAVSEAELSGLLFDELMQPGTSLGEAILNAKRDYGDLKPYQLDVILGWTLLGDPALVIEP
ncbi:MAG: C25 family cysteine peptidase [Gammaproteobacteria bacterium]